MLMTMTPFPQLVVYIGFTLNFFAVMSVASLMSSGATRGWQKLRVVSFCYPLFPVLFLLVGVWMIIQGDSDEAHDFARDRDHRRDRSAGLPLPDSAEWTRSSGGRD